MMEIDLNTQEIKLLGTPVGGQFGFEMELSAANKIGSYFDHYEILLANPTAQPEPKAVSSHVQVIVGNNYGKGFFKRNEEKNVTDSQRITFEKWLRREESQDVLLKCAFTAIKNHFVSSYWGYWNFGSEISESLFLGDEIGDEVKPPEIPTGYQIQYFTKIAQLYLDREAEIIGIILDAAWSENQIGVNFSPQQVHAGRDDIAWVA